MEPMEGWTMFVESSGGWCWSNEKYHNACYASPFWEDVSGICLEFCDSNGEGLVHCVVPFALTGDLETDVIAYRETLRPYLRLIPGEW